VLGKASIQPAPPFFFSIDNTQDDLVGLGADRGPRSDLDTHPESVCVSHGKTEGVRRVCQVTANPGLVENLNSRLRNYFTLRRHLGSSCLGLLQFFLNHRSFMRSRRAERTAKARGN
jgi:hypothetical protein